MRWHKVFCAMTVCAPLSLAGAQNAVPKQSPAQKAEPPQNVAVDMSQILQLAGGLSKTGDDDGPALPDFAEVTKGMKADTGLFTLWSYPPDAKDKDSEKLLCQIPASFLGEQFMLSTSYSGGGFMTGFPLDERVVYWQLLDKQLVLAEPETRYVVDKAREVSDVVRRTYPERIRAAVPLVTKSPAGDPVIDLGALLKSDFADILGMSGEMGPGLMLLRAASINPALSKWTKKKPFELNVEIGVELAVGRMSPPGAYDKKEVHFSFWKLPQTDYTPRAADDRVGYFLTTNQDWARASDSRDIFNRYINRWNLVKRDPSLPMCEPRQPIVYYIEKTVPVKYRRAVREGILEWNKAYEKVGFVNAVEVRQQTDDNEWKDLDPEDMRYSFFRWIVTGGGFAMGPSRANPFTGQIYDADIVFDDSMVRFYQNEAEHYIPAAAFAAKFEDPVMEKFLASFPQWRRPARDWEYTVLGGEEERQTRTLAQQRLRARGLHCCDYADGMKHQMMLGQTALAGQSSEVREKFLFDLIKEVVMHEVGHTLGLRHNFKASTVYPLAEIERRRKTGEATTGSVMDYNAALLFGKDVAGGYFVTPTIGPYDYWAIEYGYRPAGGDDADDDAPGNKEYKPEDKKGGQVAETAEKTEKTEKPEKVESAAPATPPMKEIPPEILEKLPPEAREKIKAAKARLVATNGHGGAPKTGPSLPTFKAAPSGEEAMLQKIASRAAEPELAYSTDEDTTPLGADPRSNRFDVGADPLDWARARLELVETRMNNLLDWAVKDEESWYHLRAAFLTLLMERAIVLDYVGRYIGGQYFSRSHRGDPNAPAPFTLVEPERQRAALKFIADNLFDDKAFKFNPEVLNRLAPPRWWHDGATVSFTVDFPVLDIVSRLQWWNLVDRLLPTTLERIHNAELKATGTDRFTAAEYLQTLQKSCWSDVTDLKRLTGGTWSDAAPFLSVVRRSLQREYLGLVEPLVRSRPGAVLSPDLHAMLQYQLQQLSVGLGDMIRTGKADFASQAHLTACKSRIDRMLSAELRESDGGGVSMETSMRPAGQ